MTGDFLTRLVQRALAPEPEVQPLLAPLYAPAPAADSAVPQEVEVGVEARPAAPRGPQRAEPEVTASRLQRGEEMAPPVSAGAPSPAGAPPPNPSPPVAEEPAELVGPQAPAQRAAVPAARDPAEESTRSPSAPGDAAASSPVSAGPTSHPRVPAPTVRAPEPPPAADRAAPAPLPAGPAVGYEAALEEGEGGPRAPDREAPARPQREATPAPVAQAPPEEQPGIEEGGLEVAAVVGPVARAPAGAVADAPAPPAGRAVAREAGLVPRARRYAPSGEPHPSAAPEPSATQVAPAASERRTERRPVRRAEEEIAPVIRVTIGRVEVRAAAAPSPAPPAARPSKPGLSLDEYLAQQGRRR